MTEKEQLAHYRTAYDILKSLFLIVTLVLVLVVLVMSLVVYDARKSVDLNTQRYEEMREEYKVQGIYFNNMKARIEAMNRSE